MLEMVSHFHSSHYRPSGVENEISCKYKNLTGKMLDIQSYTKISK